MLDQIVGTKVLVEVDLVKEKSAGGIVLPEEVRNKEINNITSGIFLRKGPVAFADCVDQNLDFKGQIPQNGDKVYFVRYAGRAYKHDTNDDKEYRLMNDTDLLSWDSKDKESDQNNRSAYANKNE